MPIRRSGLSQRINPSRETTSYDNKATWDTLRAKILIGDTSTVTVEVVEALVVSATETEEGALPSGTRKTT